MDFHWFKCIFGTQNKLFVTETKILVLNFRLLRDSWNKNSSVIYFSKIYTFSPFLWTLVKFILTLSSDFHMYIVMNPINLCILLFGIDINFRFIGFDWIKLKLLDLPWNLNKLNRRLKNVVLLVFSFFF